MCFDFLKEYDLFAPVVQLVFKGEDAFKSSCRGICSILLVFGLLAAFPLMLLDQLDNPEYSQTSSVFYETNGSPDTPVYEMSTYNVTLAAVVNSNSVNMVVSEYFRIQFY